LSINSKSLMGTVVGFNAGVKSSMALCRLAPLGLDV
jgi:hypothetical protein